MKTLSGAIAVAQGHDVLFEHFQDGGDMWTGTGSRELRKPVVFREAFRENPVVHCSLTLWDVDSARNLRADIEADNITPTGFDLVFRTWGDTRIARLRVSWMAIGGMCSEDSWEL